MLEMCSAEKASKASMTKRCEAPMPMMLNVHVNIFFPLLSWQTCKTYVGMRLVHKVNPFASRALSSWLMEATW